VVSLAQIATAMSARSPSSRCPSCGGEAAGNFCNRCGSPLGPRHCRHCGAEVATGARFCTACGKTLPGVAPAARSAAGLPRLPVAIGAAAVAVLILAVLLRPSSPPAAPVGTAAPAGAPGAGPPDLSQMTPRQAFDRLYNRVMTAAEQGDTATVAQFSPMALMAYGNLPEVDADARYHAAMLRLHTGDIAGAKALSDSILAAEPTHLFGFVLGASVARFQGDRAGQTHFYERFLAAWPAENGNGRLEYQDHQRMLEGFKAEAESGGNP